MPTSKTLKINPLSRKPRQQRLVIAVRGGAGVGKSYFAQTLGDAGLGRLCIFDIERKTRLLPNQNDQFDGLEVEQPNELPEFIDWALHGEGRKQNYGCYVLDSWAAYFGAKHSETLTAVRERTGNPLAQPTAEELAADQMVLQGVLRKLCMESGKSVVIVDQIPAKGKDAKEDNEVGRVLPMTASGLEYFVDVMVELSLQERNGEIVRVFQVIKSNSPAFEVGFELTGNVTFKDFLKVLKQRGGTDLPLDVPKASKEDETLPVPEAVEPSSPEMDLEALLTKAESSGFKISDVITASKFYHNQPNIYRLTTDQILDLDKRLTSRIKKNGASQHRQQKSA